MATPRPHAAPGGFGFRALLAAFLGGDYVRDFFRGVAVQTALVVLLIEAIFLAERFTPVFREAVRHEADLFGISLILLCTSPEVFDLALAVAILMACYAMLMKMRENRELLVLFASGLGPYQLSALVLVVAVLGQTVGLLGSGVVDPLSRYAQRAILFSSELRALKKGVAGLLCRLCHGSCARRQAAARRAGCGAGDRRPSARRGGGARAHPVRLSAGGAAPLAGGDGGPGASGRAR